jgi:hypothetical protein
MQLAVFGQKTAILAYRSLSLKKLPLAVFLSSDQSINQSIIHTL